VGLRLCFVERGGGIVNERFLFPLGRVFFSLKTLFLRYVSVQQCSTTIRCPWGGVQLMHFLLETAHCLFVCVTTVFG